MACSADKETYHAITKKTTVIHCSFVCFFKNIKSLPHLQYWDLFCLLPLHNASGVYSTVQQLFGAFGITITGAVYYHMVKDGDNFGSYYNAFLYGMAINIICLIGVLILLALLPKSSLPKGD
jgi:hypothetical protein